MYNNNSSMSPSFNRAGSKMHVGGTYSPTSPLRLMKSPTAKGTTTTNIWQDIFRHEQEKSSIKKRGKSKDDGGGGGGNRQQNGADDNEVFVIEQQHPYIQMALDREFIRKKFMVETSSLSQYNLKEYTHKEKNLLTDLPESQHYTLYNGVELHLKKAFGQYSRPMYKSIYYISSSSVIFFVGNYIALHNLVKDETKYIGIDTHMEDITAFAMQTADTLLKNTIGTFPILNSSPSKTNMMNNINQQNEDRPSHVGLPLKESASSQQNVPQQQQSGWQLHKELQTLVAYAEQAKETYVRETKFQSKKVYGVRASQSKSIAKPRRSIENESSPFGNIDATMNKSPSPSPTKRMSLNQSLREGEGGQLRYIVKVQVFNLNNPQKGFTLSHMFDEYFYVQQIYLRDKDSLCYTLCTNQGGDQIFFIWNFRKETVISHVEMKPGVKINKFMVTPNKAELILFIGQGYLKYYEANFTNKIMKENSLNIVPMKVEKENNFVDMEYLVKSDLFILISDSPTNNIFIFEKNSLKHKMLDQTGELTSEVDSVMSDSLEIGDLSDQEQISKGEEFLRVQSVGTNVKDTSVRFNSPKKHKKGVSQQEQEENLTQDQQEKESAPLQSVKFQKVTVTQKGFMIGTTNGYLMCYEFRRGEQAGQEPKLMYKVHLSKRVQAIVSMSLSKCINDDYQVAIAGVYQKILKPKHYQSFEAKRPSINPLSPQSIKGGQIEKNQQGSSFFMPNVISTTKQNLINTLNKQNQQMNPHQRQQIQQAINDQPEIEERIEFFIVDLKSISTSQLNKVVQKVFNKGAHDGSIYQIAQTKHKSQIYTLSEGKNLKIWTHTNEWNGISNYYFDEQPLCVDVHPSSWQIALGFKSGIKIYQSLDKDLKLQFEKFGKACLSITYADGGQLLACTNAVYIDIIDPIRMQVVATLFGHKGLVNSLTWTLNSKFLISTCNNGGLFFWQGNMKEQAKFGGESAATSNGSGIQPLHYAIDKNYSYLSIAYDEEIDTTIALTSTSTLRLLINQGQDEIHEVDLLRLPSHNGGGDFSSAAHLVGNGARATCMSFSKALNVVAVGFSDGKLAIINWPITPNTKTYKYEVMLQKKAITYVLFSLSSSRYLWVGCDDGVVYCIETWRVVEGIERSWLTEHVEGAALQKKRETHGLRGHSITDNFLITNKTQIQRVNNKIERLEMSIKSQEVNYKVKVQKKLKQFEKQKKQINQEQLDIKRKQDQVRFDSANDFLKEKERLLEITEEQKLDQNTESKQVIANKEKNMNFVSNENDDLEMKIMRLKQTIVQELNDIEKEHMNAVGDLVNSYEQSIKLAQEEVKNTISKLKTNGNYYENMIGMQEKDYEEEIGKLKADLIGETSKFKQRTDQLEEEDIILRDGYENIEDDYKEHNQNKKQKLQLVKKLKTENTIKERNIDRLNQKFTHQTQFVAEKEGEIFDINQEKKQQENLIVFLSNKIKELQNEKKPQEEKKKELETVIEDTYAELQHDYKFRRFLDLKLKQSQNQMKIIEKEIQLKEALKECIDQKEYIFKRELQHLSEAKSLKGWTQKVQGMLVCMLEIQNCLSAEDVTKLSTAFIHIAEIMESNARPFRVNQEEEDQLAKQSRLNEMELAYYRNKNSEKLTETQFRYQALFKQLEKQIKKLRFDNIKLIEEFNNLTCERKKLNDLRLMIKQSIKEVLGEDFTENMADSSDDENVKGKGVQKRSSTQKAIQKIKAMNRSKSSTQILGGQKQKSKDKLSIQGGQLTARDLYQTKESNQLPDLRSGTLVGSKTQRDLSEGSRKIVSGGFIINKETNFQKRRLQNKLNQPQSQPGNQVIPVNRADGRKYLDKIVQEFEKNRKHIESQTKSMESIQKQISTLISSQKSALPTVTEHQKMNVPFGSVGSSQTIPTLNLGQLQKNTPIVSTRHTMTTRVPNSSDRTGSSINGSLLQPGLSLTAKQLPIIREATTYSTLKNSDIDQSSQNKK